MTRLLLAVFVGKIVLLATRLLSKTGGSAAPGLVALSIDPQLITKLAAQIDTNIVITGTNGKTTTSSMIAQIMKQSKRVIHNNTGSNLSRGIASKLLSASSFMGQVTADVGIWEADEAAFVDIVEQVKPYHIVILNIARDQLDRYGEIDSIIKKWKSALGKASWDKVLYLNADDGYIYDLKNTTNAIIQTFGIENSHVKSEKSTKHATYTIKARIIESTYIDHTELVFSYHGFGKKVSLPIAGGYNVYNFLSAFLVSSQLHISHEDILSAVTLFTPAFGRMEKVKLGVTDGLIALIKNPSGASQVIHTFSQLFKKDDGMLIMLNDNIADGTDVSWIWDADFEKIAPLLSEVHVSGTRRYDLALRLYYAGVAADSIKIHAQIPHLDQLPKHDKGRLFLMPTYTALLELQKYLKDHGYKEKYWHE